MNKFQMFVVDYIGYTEEEAKELKNDYIVEHSKELGLYQELLNYIS